MSRLAYGMLSGCFTALFIGPSSHQTPNLIKTGAWVPISERVLNGLSDDGKKIGYPGLTAGISVDRSNGDVYMVIPDQGIWRSSDRAKTFSRVDSESTGGRCETGFALNADPAGNRMACFMLDGASAIMPGGGKAWRPLKQNGRGWDYGTVDWSESDPQTLLAVHHESGEDLHVSSDGGKSWRLIGMPYKAIGIFDAHTFVASQGMGIVRTTDGGATWKSVSDRTPTGRVLSVFKGTGYWVSKEGLLVSKDKGATWQTQGSPIESAWGPYFGKNERQIAVVGRVGTEAGFWRSDDAGTTWKFAAPFPQFEKVNPPDWTPSKQWAAGWFTNFGWDPIGDIFYASRMGHQAVKWEQHK